MNGCEYIEILQARRLHGGGLSPEEEALLGRHLAGCASCRRRGADAEALHEALLLLPGRRVEPPPGLDGRILARIDLPSLAAARWRRAAVVAGAMAAGVLITLAVQRTLPGSGRPAAGPAVASLPAPVVPAPRPLPAEERPAVRRAAPAAVRVAKAAPKPEVQVVREVKIFLFHPEAKQVAVTGDFNGWNPEGVRLHPGDRPGLWEGELRLGPGAYSYNFIVDGDVLVPDPAAAEQAPDGYGGTNSILLVKGASKS
jgi:hypothetical protein